MSRVIVSFTSYPARIKTICNVIDSIVKQTILPDKIILYLSSNQFLMCDKLPDFGEYEKYGFELHWHEEDLGPHKKYYYAMQEYPEDIIITIDDDVCYKKTMIEELINYHNKYPKAVIARRAHLVTWMQDGMIAPYEKWYMETLRYIGIPRMDLVATGCSGILYPPHLFKTEIFNKKMFMEKAPYADDLWLKVMELYSKIPVVLTKEYFDDVGLGDYSANGLYTAQNSNGGNDVQLYALLNAYGVGEVRGNFLLRRLGSNGKLMLEDYENARKSDVWRMLYTYLKTIDWQDNILIYGAGNVARKLYKIIEKGGYIGKVRAFIVKCTEKNEQELGNIKVVYYADYMNSSEKIIIGLGEEKQEEVYRSLIKTGIDKRRIIKLNPFISRLITMF